MSESTVIDSYTELFKKKPEVGERSYIRGVLEQKQTAEFYFDTRAPGQVFKVDNPEIVPNDFQWDTPVELYVEFSGYHAFRIIDLKIVDPQDEDHLVSLIRKDIRLALQESTVSIFDLGGWYQILEYNAFLSKRHEDPDSVTGKWDHFDLLIREMNNLVIMGFHTKKVISMTDLYSRGITITQIHLALEKFRTT